MHDLEHHGAHNTAIQPAHATDHQQQHHVGRAVEIEHVERRKAGGLRQQGAGRPGNGRGHGVDGGQACRDRYTDGHGAQAVVAHRHQGRTEGREHEPAQQHKQQQRHTQGVVRGGDAGQAKLEAAQHRCHHHTLQPIGAAGQPVELVCQFHQDRRHAQRHHQARQVGATHDGQAAHRAEHGRYHDGKQQAEQRVGVYQLGEQRGRVSAHAEKGRMPERHNTGVAQNQVKRNREQRKNHDLVDHQRMAAQHHGRRKRHQPQHRFPRLDAGELLQRRVGRGSRC